MLIAFIGVLATFALLIGIAAIIEKSSGSDRPDLGKMLAELRDAIQLLHHLHERPVLPPMPPAAPPIPKASPDNTALEQVVHLLEELREINLMSPAQRESKLQQYAQQRKSSAVALIEQHIRREEWAAAEELTTKLEGDFAGDADALRVRKALEAGRAAAENEALSQVRSNVEDFMAIASWDQACSAAEAFVQNFPHNAEGRRLLERVTRERTVFSDSTVQRLYDQIKRDLERRQWRKALSGAQRLLERFPDHAKTLKIRQQIRTIQDNAEIEERQDQEARIQQLIKSKRFAEAIQLGEQLIRSFPLSPQADAMEEMLPKLRERAIQQEASNL